MLPVPQPLCIGLSLTALLCLWSGFLRNELVLFLLGAIPLAVIAYCFCATLILSAAHSRKAQGLDVRLTPEAVPVGAQDALEITCRSPQKFFRMPGILLRYELELHTKDGRIFQSLFDPDHLQQIQSPLAAPGRGAYGGEEDRFIIMDILGLFRSTMPLPQKPGYRLLVTPQSAEEPLRYTSHSGGDEQRQSSQYVRTDNLIEQRPYIPGDDPRRINWKLYGHIGDLFIREGEREPPPHSQLAILVDSQADPTLYSPQEAQQGVDLLCENALALAVLFTARGMDVSVGYAQAGPGTGGFDSGLSAGELAALLAMPAALPLDGPESLRLPQDSRSILVLALPRTAASNTCLDRLLKNRQAAQRVDIAFLFAAVEPKKSQGRGIGIAHLRPFIRKTWYQGSETPNLEECAGICERIYDQKEGVYARSFRL